MKEDTVYAKSRYLKSSARKARLVMDLIRGKEALKSVDVLKYTNKAVAEDILKTLNSAIHNATFNKGWDKKKLYGHGVGMSARDASIRASEKGENFEQLLKYYYTGVGLERMYQ